MDDKQEVLNMGRAMYVAVLKSVNEGDVGPLFGLVGFIEKSHPKPEEFQGVIDMSHKAQGIMADMLQELYLALYPEGGSDE